MQPAAFLHKQLSYFIGAPDARRHFVFRPPAPASPMFLHERAQIVLRRTEVLAWTFMVLVVLWLAIDALVFPPEVVTTLMIGRVAAAFGLGVPLILSLVLVRRATWLSSYLTLAGLVAIPAVFALHAQPVLEAWQQRAGQLTELQVAAITLYRQLPAIYVSGLALFPMVMLESLPLALLIAATAAAVDMRGTGGVIQPDQWAELWVLLVVGGAAALAGVLQFNLLWQNHRLRDYDTETGLMTRDTALALLQLHWHERGSQPSALTIGLLGDVEDASPDTRTRGAGNGPLARMSAWLCQPLPPGVQAVRWSRGCLGLVAVGVDPAVLEHALDMLCAHGKAGGPRVPAYVLAERRGDHSVGPVDLLHIAEQKLKRVQRTEPVAS